MDIMADFILYFLILNGILAMLEICFAGRFTGKKLHWYQCILYIILMFIVYEMEIYIGVSFPMATIMELAALFITETLILKTPKGLSLLTTIITITIIQVVNGIFQCLSRAMALQGLLNWICALAALVCIYVIFKAVLKALVINKSTITKYEFILFLPTLFILLVVQYVIEGGKYIGTLSILVMEIIALLSLFSVIFAYKRLSEAFVLHLKNELLRQQSKNQQDYMKEVQTRYENTRAFRHDVKNHYTVLYELMKNNKEKEALKYLGNLQEISDSMSFPCHSGNTVIDMLLCNKLGLASSKGIKIDVKVNIPKDSGFEDMDLCVVFSNAIDNAINGCIIAKAAERFIDISTSLKGSFFMIEIINICEEVQEDNFKFGIGLSNIKTVSEKYNGTVRIERTDNTFKLNVLLVIPQH